MVVVGICGITGLQGGAVANICLENNHSVIGLTRNLESTKSIDLINRDVKMFKGDYDNPTSLKGVFDNCDVVFVVTNFWDHMNPKREYTQAKHIVDSVTESNVKHIIWSTLEDTRDYNDDIQYLGDYKVPHFDEKGMISKYLDTLSINVTHLYTSFFYENLINTMKMKKDDDGIRRLCLPINNATLPIVSVKDIGKMVHSIIQHKLYGNVGIASEHITGVNMVKILNDVLEEPVEYVSVPAEVYRSFGFPGCKDIGNMFEFKTIHNESFCNMRNMDNVNKYITPISFKQWCLDNKHKL